jgi:surfactin synthase thioesterase subunit
MMRRQKVTPWLWHYGDPATEPTFVLAPFGGGSVYSVAEWTTELLRAGQTALAVQYPGRGPRASEPHAQRMAELADNATADLLRQTDGPLVLVGHSLGGLLCHEITVRLEAAGRRVELLVVSSARPPGQNRMALAKVLGMDRDAWRAELSATGFGEQRLMAQPELLDMVISVLRPDYLLLARHTEAGGVVGCPLLAIGGDRDEWVTPRHLAGWGALTTGECATAVLPGGHFYYRDQLPTFSRLIHRAIDGLRAGSGRPDPTGGHRHPSSATAAASRSSTGYPSDGDLSTTSSSQPMIVDRSAHGS